MLENIIKKIIGNKQNTSPHYLPYLEDNGAILRPEFNIRLDDPKSNKIYVSLEEQSILSCNIIFESEEGKVQIGKNNSIGQSTIICRTSITLEDNIFISWGCTICDHNFHSLNYKERRNDLQQLVDNIKKGKNLNHNKNWQTVDSKPIKICSDAWIGMNAVIMKGVTIGRGAIVGANSVVTKDVPDFAVVAGNPAQIIKTLDH